MCITRCKRAIEDENFKEKSLESGTGFTRNVYITANPGSKLDYSINAKIQRNRTILCWAHPLHIFFVQRSVRIVPFLTNFPMYSWAEKFIFCPVVDCKWWLQCNKFKFNLVRFLLNNSALYVYVYSRVRP